MEPVRKPGSTTSHPRLPAVPTRVRGPRRRRAARAWPAKMPYGGGLRPSRMRRRGRAGNVGGTTDPTSEVTAMKKRIVILGGGTGGTLIANRLRRRLGRTRPRSPSSTGTTATSTSPACCSCPFGLADAERHRALAPARSCTTASSSARRDVDRVDIEADAVHLADGTTLDYDVLVVATARACCRRRPRG